MENIRNIPRLRIAFSGASGTGKTTLAKYVGESYGLPFISSSFSDLVPETKSMPHEDMLNQNLDKMFEQDQLLVSKRRAIYSKNPRMVTDRCYLDNIAYMIHKYYNSGGLTRNVTKLMGLLIKDFDILFILAYTPSMVTTWGVENNGKRILSGWFQYRISLIMQDIVLNHPLIDCINYIDCEEGYSVVEVFSGDKKLKVVEITTTDKLMRMQIIKHVLNKH